MWPITIFNIVYTPSKMYLESPGFFHQLSLTQMW